MNIENWLTTQLPLTVYVVIEWPFTFWTNGFFISYFVITFNGIRWIVHKNVAGMKALYLMAFSFELGCENSWLNRLCGLYCAFYGLFSSFLGHCKTSTKDLLESLMWYILLLPETFNPLNTVFLWFLILSKTCNNSLYIYKISDFHTSK